MQVILLDRIRNLGDLGDEVRVRPGFARNYLIPYGKAVPATDQERAQVAERRRELEAQSADRRRQSQLRAETFSSLVLEFSRRATEDGSLYGSVSAGDIAEAAVTAGFELDRSEVQLPEGPIKESGEHKIVLSLHPEVDVTIRVQVTAEA